MKWMFMLALSFFSLSSFAADSYLQCMQALPASAPGFCASFKAVAACHCEESGVPKPQCQNMNLIYQFMIARFGSVDRACEYQRDTSKQVCMDDWSCYRTGGKDSTGYLCSSTGKACSN